MFQSFKIVNCQVQHVEAGDARVVMNINSVPNLLFVHVKGVTEQCWDRYIDECLVSVINIHDNLKAVSHSGSLTCFAILTTMDLFIWLTN